AGRLMLSRVESRRDGFGSLRCRRCATTIRADEESVAGIARVLGDASIPASWKLLALSGQHTRGPSRVHFGASPKYRFNKRKSPRPDGASFYTISRQFASALRYRYS